jgi:hypothetical protein
MRGHYRPYYEKLLLAIAGCLLALFTLACFALPAQAQRSLLLRDSVVCPQAPAFLARANAITALDGTHTIAYTNLICGLVADGVWPKFDVLMVFATQSSGVSLLNLTNATYSATSTATFTTDRGWFDSGVFRSILTNFNPIAAVGPQFTQNSAHISFWNLLNATSTVEALGDSNHALIIYFQNFPTITFMYASMTRLLLAGSPSVIRAAWF